MGSKPANPRVYKLFMSHTWNHGNAFFELYTLLGRNKSFHHLSTLSPRTLSIMRYGSSEIRHEHITRKMKNCDIVLVMCGLYSAYGETMREEMEVCKELGKPMIAIERYNEKLTSPLVKESADRVVPWNSRRIIRAIKELT